MITPLNSREIIDKGGGPLKLAERSRELVQQRRLKKPIAEKTIYAWFENGIPEKHWGFVISECRVTATQLHKANETLRANEADSAPLKRSKMGPARAAA